MTVPPEDFYPRSPCGERRILSDMANAVFEFLSTLSLRRATGIADAVALALDISIHALLAESDHKSNGSRCTSPQFLSTLSLRRATVWIPLDDGSLFISIHALLAESDLQAVAERDQVAISIHALLTESDTIFAVRPYDAPIFLSTLSLRRAT